MNEEIIRDKLDFLYLKFANYKSNNNEFFFEPDYIFYKNLRSGNEDSLQYAIMELTKHLDMDKNIAIQYDWGIKMELSEAGIINIGGGKYSITIPFSIVGNPHSLGTILAHEVTHAFLISNGILLEDRIKNEILTDIATIYLGLGKLLLNGLNYCCSDEKFSIGYLSPKWIVYCYKKVNMARLISNENACNNLTVDAIKLLNDF